MALSVEVINELLNMNLISYQSSSVHFISMYHNFAY